MNRYKISTQISFGSRYYFAAFTYAKSMKGAKQTKVFKHYLNEFKTSKIVGLQIEPF